MSLGEATRVALQVFKATGGLVWKRHPMNHTRRANAKTRHARIRQAEEVLRVCAAAPPHAAADPAHCPPPHEAASGQQAHGTAQQ